MLLLKQIKFLSWSFSFIPSVPIISCVIFWFSACSCSPSHVYFRDFAVLLFVLTLACPVGWGCKIHWLCLCRGVRTPHTQTSVPDITLNNLMVRLQYCWSFGGMRSTSSLPSLPGRLCDLSVGQIELKCVLMLSWIALNRTALTFKLYTYAKLNCLK